MMFAVTKYENKNTKNTRKTHGLSERSVNIYRKDRFIEIKWFLNENIDCVVATVVNKESVFNALNKFLFLKTLQLDS